MSPELDLRLDPTTEAAERISEALRHRPPTMRTPKDEDGYPLDWAEGGDLSDSGEAR